MPPIHAVRTPDLRVEVTTGGTSVILDREAATEMVEKVILFADLQRIERAVHLKRTMEEIGRIPE